MRKKLFGAFAALAVGSGAASAQTPFPPYGGNAGSPYTNQPIPAMIPGGPNGAVLPQLNPGPGMIPPGADPAQMLPPNHQPVYPPPGPYGQTMYESPYTGQGGFGGGPGMEGGGPPGPVAPRVWFKGDYLLMFLKPMPSNAVLVTTGLANPGGTSDNGVLGQATTVALFGDRNYEFNAVSGFRLEGGFWGSEDQRLGANVSAIYIAPSSVGFNGSSGTNGSPLLGRPIFNNNPNTVTLNGTAGGNDIALVTNPGVGSGNIFAQVQSRFFSIEANAILNLYRADPGAGGWNLNFLAGYRYMELQESILVQSNTFLLAGVSYNNIAIPAGSSVGVQDYFDSRNRFNAGQVGLEASTQQGRWAFSISGKGAFGVNTQRTLIEGNTTDFGANNFVGGVYANTSNVGTYISNKFAIGVDANATIGYMFTPRFMGTVGYNYLFLNNVVRAGNSISQTVDPMTAPGYGSPGGVVPTVGSGAPNLMNDTFWMHGINFGFSLTF